MVNPTPIHLEELFTKLLDLPPLEVTLAEVREQEIILHCRSVLGQAHCPVCLEKCNFVKDTYVRKLRDLSISGKKVILHFTVRQFVCQDCNRHFHEQYPFAAKNGIMTQRYEDFIYYRCQGTDLRYVCLQGTSVGVQWVIYSIGRPEKRLVRVNCSLRSPISA